MEVELSIVENQRQFTTGQQQGLCARAFEKMAAIVTADIVPADIWGREKPNVTLGSDYEMNRANDKNLNVIKITSNVFERIAILK